MTFTALLLACIAILNLGIGLFVYRRHPSAPSTRAFALMATALSLWTTGLAIAHYAGVANVWGLRLAFSAASLIPLGVLGLVESIPVADSQIRLRTRMLAPAALIFS